MIMVLIYCFLAGFFFRYYKEREERVYNISKVFFIGQVVVGVLRGFQVLIYNILRKIFLRFQFVIVRLEEFVFIRLLGEVLSFKLLRAFFIRVRRFDSDSRRFIILFRFSMNIRNLLNLLGLQTFLAMVFISFLSTLLVWMFFRRFFRVFRSTCSLRLMFSMSFCCGGIGQYAIIRQGYFEFGVTSCCSIVWC